MEIPDASAVPVPAEEVPAPAERRRLRLDLTVVLAASVLPQLYFGLREFVSRADTPLEFGTLKDSLGLLVGTFSLSVVLLFVHLRSGDPPEAVGLGRQRLLPLVVGSAAVWAVQRWIYAYGWAAFRTSFPHRSIAIHHSVGWAETSALVGSQLTNAFAEELGMRGLLVDRLARLTRAPFLSALAAALLFGAYHLYQGVHGAFWAFVFGFLQGLLFLVTRRLWPLVLGHALSNLETFLH